MAVAKLDHAEVVPLVFQGGLSWADIGLTGAETVTIPGLANVRPRQEINLEITYADGVVRKVPTLCRIDTEDEIHYYNNGGILQYVLRNLAAVA